jgi:uncharacterized protein YcaQ
MITLTNKQARRYILAYQDLYPPRKLRGAEGVLSYIRKAGCIQYDPLHVAGHNHELVLQARVKDFTPDMLYRLLYRERRLLDGWDKNMSIYPVEDWPCFCRIRQRFAEQMGPRYRQAEPIIPQVRRALEERGPLSSLDLDNDEVVDWWWAPTRLARVALESMFFTGEVIVHHKVHTRRVFDLTHRHIPDKIRNAPDPNPTEEAYHDWLVARRIGSIGLLWNRPGDAWLGSDLKAGERSAAFARLLDAGRIREVRVEGIPSPLYMPADAMPVLEQALEDREPAPQAVFLAPLDNMLWDRKLIRALFGFDYKWEVYTPADQRKYGYYVLPVLYGDRFVARCEPVRDRKTKTLTLVNWWWEEGVRISKQMGAALARCMKAYMGYLGVERLALGDGVAEMKGMEWLETLVHSE